MPWLSDNRSNKKIARSKVFSCGPKKSVLLLPGYRCDCVQHALYSGIINQDTICTFVERDLETACGVSQWVMDNWSLPIPPMINHCELHKLEMIPIDFAYIDLFGNLTKPTVDWIRNQLIPNIMPKCDLFFTFSLSIRGNDFIKNALMTIRTKYKDLLQCKLKTIQDINTDAKEVAALYEIMFEIMFKDYNYSIEHWSYRDTTTMLLAMIKNIRLKPETLRKKYKEKQ